MSFTPNLVVGLVITLLGAVLLLDKMALVEPRAILQYWPVLLTLFGVSVIVQALRGNTSGDVDGRGRPIVAPGFVLMLIVIWLVGTNASDRRLRGSGAPDDPELTLLAVMGKDERASTSSAFRGAQMTSVMGRTRLDLRQATVADGGEATVEVFGVMGATEVFVPEGWVVDVRATAVMGGVRDRRGLAAGNDDDDGDRRTRRERRRAARDGTTTSAAPASPSPAPQPTETPATAMSPSDAAVPLTPTSAPRLVLKGVIVAGALIIRS